MSTKTTKAPEPKIGIYNRKTGSRVRDMPIDLLAQMLARIERTTIEHARTLVQLYPVGYPVYADRQTVAVIEG